jgi:hypothetical protein
VLRKACAAVEPALTGERSRMESGNITNSCHFIVGCAIFSCAQEL